MVQWLKLGSSFTCLRYESSMVGSYFSTKIPCTNCTVFCVEKEEKICQKKRKEEDLPQERLLRPFFFLFLLFSFPPSSWSGSCMSRFSVLLPFLFSRRSSPVLISYCYIFFFHFFLFLFPPFAFFFFLLFLLLLFSFFVVVVVVCLCV